MKLPEVIAFATEDMGVIASQKPCIALDKLMESHNMKENDVGKIFVMILDESEVFFDDENMPKIWAASKTKIADAMDSLGSILDNCTAFREHVVEQVEGRYELLRKTLSYAAVMYNRRYIRDRKTKIAAVASGMEIDNYEKILSESENGETVVPSQRVKKTYITELELLCKQQAETITIFTALLRDILASPIDVGTKIAAVLLDMKHPSTPNQ